MTVYRYKPKGHSRWKWKMDKGTFVNRMNSKKFWVQYGFKQNPLWFWEI